MKREQYLQDDHVRGFIGWARPLVRGDSPFAHNWYSPRFRDWRCESLFDAYERYDWHFNFTTSEGPIASGRTLTDTLAVFDTLRERLRSSAADDNVRAFLEAAIEVATWGGVRRTASRLRAALSACDFSVVAGLKVGAQLLDPRTADLDKLGNVSLMNSGFSKIYSLMLDDFPIYDSRVACALGSLVVQYCEEHRLARVPETLAFRIPPSQGNTRRDPSRGPWSFRRLYYEGEAAYARSNVMAAWVLKPLADEGEFGQLLPERRLHALQSALFMAGYAPWPAGSYSQSLSQRTA